MYSAVFSLKTGWVVGKIQDHVAKPLTEDEVVEVCNQLNNIADGESKSATKTGYAENSGHDQIQEIVKKQFDMIMENREKYIQAFVAETGLHPTECEMVEQHINGIDFIGTKIFFRKRSES